MPSTDPVPSNTNRYLKEYKLADLFSTWRPNNSHPRMIKSLFVVIIHIRGRVWPGATYHFFYTLLHNFVFSSGFHHTPQKCSISWRSTHPFDKKEGKNTVFHLGLLGLGGCWDCHEGQFSTRHNQVSKQLTTLDKARRRFYVFYCFFIYFFSTDLHSGNVRGAAKNLPWVTAKLLHLGDYCGRGRSLWYHIIRNALGGNSEGSDRGASQGDIQVSRLCSPQTPASLLYAIHITNTNHNHEIQHWNLNGLFSRQGRSDWES